MSKVLQVILVRREKTAESKALTRLFYCRVGQRESRAFNHCFMAAFEEIEYFLYNIHPLSHYLAYITGTLLECRVKTFTHIFTTGGNLECQTDLIMQVFGLREEKRVPRVSHCL